MIAVKGVQAETDDGTAAVGAGAGADKSGPRRMLSEKQVLAIIPIGRTTLFRMEKVGRFPRSTYISPNRRVWFEDEIIAWQNEINGRGRGRANHPSGSKS
jgi:prophage regulatory protein